MRSQGPGLASTVKHVRYDARAEAKRISEINEAIERKQALMRVPAVYKQQVDSLVGMLFRARVR